VDSYEITEALRRNYLRASLWSLVAPLRSATLLSLSDAYTGMLYFYLYWKFIYDFTLHSAGKSLRPEILFLGRRRPYFISTTTEIEKYSGQKAK